MIDVLTIALRVAFAAGLLVGIAGSLTEWVPPGWRRAGFTAAVVTAVALIALRIILRLTVPEEVPSFGG